MLFKVDPDLPWLATMEAGQIRQNSDAEAQYHSSKPAPVQPTYLSPSYSTSQIFSMIFPSTTFGSMITINQEQRTRAQLCAHILAYT